MSCNHSGRYIAAGTWLRFQKALGALMRAAIVTAVVLSPITGIAGVLAFGPKEGVALCAATVSIFVVAGLYCYLLGGLLEPLRTDGIPILER